ncbi:helix-turn-helix transcriptional regulator [Weissella cibaria]|uniref:helix-turn-helix transcriptional regulator n=1 Tax=Weissella cibaria TaxID=137591 RepID=UPI0021BF84F5|nr:HTH domain-containing protein [Weissella cibaria]
MAKFKRINNMMRYINNRQQFTLSELMAEFDISRSTAIRDIREIEDLGVPLVSEPGRDGGYFVMHNNLLPAVQFTNDEIKAIFISFMATVNQQLPFLNNRQTISEKLLGIVSETQQDELITLKKILQFENTNPNNPDLIDLSDMPHPKLNELISLLLQSQFVQIQIANHNHDFFVQHIFNAGGQWFVEAIDLHDEKQTNFPINAIQNMSLGQNPSRFNHQNIDKLIATITPKDNLTFTLDSVAIQRFKDTHPHSGRLAFLDPFQLSAQFSTVIDINNNSDLDYFADWMFFLGSGITNISMPHELSERIQTKALAWM